MKRQRWPQFSVNSHSEVYTFFTLVHWPQFQGTCCLYCFHFLKVANYYPQFVYLKSRLVQRTLKTGHFILWNSPLGGNRKPTWRITGGRGSVYSRPWINSHKLDLFSYSSANIHTISVLRQAFTYFTVSQTLVRTHSILRENVFPDCK